MNFIYRKELLKSNGKNSIYCLDIWQVIKGEKTWVGYTTTDGSFNDTAEIFRYLQVKGLIPAEAVVFGAGKNYWEVEEEIEDYMLENHISISWVSDLSSGR